MPITTPHPEGAILALKVVPGASRERIVGPLGDRLKVAVQKPPEKGAANKAVCALVARALGLKPADIQVLRGETRPEKDLLVSRLGPEEVAKRLGLPGV